MFTNRSIKRKVLLETSPLNFVLSPDNSKNSLSKFKYFFF
jgi:hypothetical protein